MPKERNYRTVVSALSGSNGVIYLMFLGAERYVNQIQPWFVKSGFYKNKENVNQSFTNLVAREYGDFFLKFTPHEGKNLPGSPRFYVANWEPISLTLRQFQVEFNEERLKSFLVAASSLNEDFPKLLVSMNESQHAPAFQKGLRWPITLGWYFLHQYLNLEPVLSIENEGRLLDQQDFMRVRKTILRDNPGAAKPRPFTPELESLERFIQQYPGGCDAFVTEIGQTMMWGSIKFMFGPLSKKVFSMMENFGDAMSL